MIYSKDFLIPNLKAANIFVRFGCIQFIPNHKKVVLEESTTVKLASCYSTEAIMKTFKYLDSDLSIREREKETVVSFMNILHVLFDEALKENYSALTSGSPSEILESKSKVKEPHELRQLTKIREFMAQCIQSQYFMAFETIVETLEEILFGEKQMRQFWKAINKNWVTFPSPT